MFEGTKILIYPAPFNMCRYLIFALKTISGMNNEKTLGTFFALNYWLGEFPLAAMVNHFKFWCQEKQLIQLYYKICPPCETQHCFFGNISIVQAPVGH